LVRNAAQGNLVPGWQHTDPELLLAQGRLGADEMVTMFAHIIMPYLCDLSERFVADSVCFLDIGAGVGSLSIAMARRWPHLRVIAIEPGLAPLAEARQNIINAALEDRIELRKQRIEEITEDGVFDLVWLPQMFISHEDLSRGLAPVWRALRPGGWVWLPVLNDSGTKLRYTVNRLRNILWGGSPMHCDQLVHLLVGAGFDSVRSVANKPTGEHRFVIGRRPY
jgi:SAM-dependent methyltransferase